jgi:hypothetical protein
MNSSLPAYRQAGKQGGDDPKKEIPQFIIYNLKFLISLPLFTLSLLRANTTTLS